MLFGHILEKQLGSLSTRSRKHTKPFVKLLYDLYMTSFKWNLNKSTVCWSSAPRIAIWSLF